MSSTIESGPTIDRPVISLNPVDNVFIARVDLPAGTRVGVAQMEVLEPVKAGGKLAARAIDKGEAILKYGTTIGFAVTPIPAGALLDGQNIEYRELCACGDLARVRARQIHGHRAQ
jgi:Flp pilus assembly protein CpaB